MLKKDEELERKRERVGEIEEKQQQQQLGWNKKALHKDNIILTFEKYLLSNENVFRS